MFGTAKPEQVRPPTTLSKLRSFRETHLLGLRDALLTGRLHVNNAISLRGTVSYRTERLEGEWKHSASAVLFSGVVVHVEGALSQGSLLRGFARCGQWTSQKELETLDSLDSVSC